MHASAVAPRQSPRTNGSDDDQDVAPRAGLVEARQPAGGSARTLNFDRGTVLLLREMTHRINNEFASLMGLMARAERDLTDERAKAAFEVVSECLYNHAQVHRALAVPARDDLIDATQYLRSLCEAIRGATLARRGITLTIMASQHYAAAAQCWKLGMIVSELVNNSARHAFAEGGGRIRVDLRSVGNHLRCRVSDDGTRRAHDRPSSRRSGLMIVEALAAAMAGTIEERWTAHGASTLIRFPAVHEEQILPTLD